MALRKRRGRNDCYDNPVVGSQCTSFECTKVGFVPPVELAATSTGFRDNTSVTNAPSILNTQDDIQAGVVTLAGERLG
jgi:hypothetical protein